MSWMTLGGPRLSTKLTLLGLVLLIIPAANYRQLVEIMGAFLVNGQSQTQLLTANGISTLLNGRDDLFNELPVSLKDYATLNAYPLTGAVQLDGLDSDWGTMPADLATRFGLTSSSEASDGTFDVVFAERNGQLYAHMRVFDRDRVYRDPDYLRLDNSDHVRISFTGRDGSQGRLLLTFTKPGVVTAYHMDMDWRLAETGQPENRLDGAISVIDDGYLLEFRLPLAMLGPQPHLGLAYADVDDPTTRKIEHIVQSLPTSAADGFNLLILHSPEVANVIRGLSYAGARIVVIDAERRVRADTGDYGEPDAKRQPDTGASDGWFDWLRPIVSQLVERTLTNDGTSGPNETPGTEVLASALNGVPAARRQTIDGAQLIVAAHPIILRDEVIGAVIVEQNTDEILAIQRVALEQIMQVSALSLLAVVLLLFAFSLRLAWRIRQLRTETSSAIDQYGRMRQSKIASETHSGDEIGDLARSISNMLTLLHQHNSFLENMPRTLRHEINNPLNTLLTSLQNLENSTPEVAESKYLESAKRGVMRIGSIVQNLAEAASLEESLDSDDLEVIDLASLLRSYIANLSLTHPDITFIPEGTEAPAWVRAADYLIEQLMDKIIDNAVDFHQPGTPIRVELRRDRDDLLISVTNSGPSLPAGEARHLFDSMVSHRVDRPDNRLHFGLGLYVVRVIAAHHNGRVEARDLPDDSGVTISVRLPLVDVAQRRPEPWARSAPGLPGRQPSPVGTRWRTSGQKVLGRH